VEDETGVGRCDLDEVEEKVGEAWGFQASAVQSFESASRIIQAIEQERPWEREGIDRGGR
jgi:hypothetical protein